MLWFVLVPLPVAYGVPTLLVLFGKSNNFRAGAISVIGLVAVALGTAGLLWCFVEFIRRGRGTPAPYEPPRELVIGGLYRYTRNPMYVGVLLIVVGEALWWASWVIIGYAGLLWVAFHAWVILYEEPSLRRRFGRQYERYCSAVPRWIGVPEAIRSA